MTGIETTELEALRAEVAALRAEVALLKAAPVPQIHHHYPAAAPWPGQVIHPGTAIPPGCAPNPAVLTINATACADAPAYRADLSAAGCVGGYAGQVYTVTIPA